jgi:large subunit ribosomal protein L30e
MIDVNKAITTTAKTGRIQIGANSALKSAQAKKAKMIVFASNCPSDIKAEIEEYCSIGEIPVHTITGESTDLGALCGKPFAICVLTVKDPGDSQILKITEE